MALKTSLNIQVYFENRTRNIVQYIEVLNQDQITEIQNPIIKSYIVNNLYAKIGLIQGDKNGINLRLDFYTDSTKSKLIDSKNYNFVPNVADTAPNFIKQGYEYLKTLDIYKDAIDLFDEGQTI